MIANVLIYFLGIADRSNTLYFALRFDRDLILQGQVWRLFTYAFTGAFSYNNILLLLLFAFCYFSIGRAIENIWGTLRFNLFYFAGVLMMDIYAMIFNCRADPYYLNLSLFLSYATLFPNAQFLILFIIPIKAWILALIDLVMLLYGCLVSPFPYNLFPLVALANYFLFFGKDIANVFPLSWQTNFRRIFRKKQKNTVSKGPIPFHTAGSYEAATAAPKAPYTHRCVICGRTDISDPQLEFRYCSRCSGYHCYCQEHINNHTHIE